jgi:hypothetical protein
MFRFYEEDLDEIKQVVTACMQDGETSVSRPNSKRVAIPTFGKEHTMSIQISRLRARTLATIALLSLGLALPPGDAVAEQKTLKDRVVGTWIYVSVDTVSPDGSRVPMFGSKPRGQAIFGSNGRYMLITSRPDLPKFASNNRNDGTSDEYKAVVQGSIAHFGTYTVNEADKSITFHIETSTFPNWNGVEQKRPITLSGDELKWETAASSGGTAQVVLKRAE